jgi:electron transport complex protein RnfD
MTYVDATTGATTLAMIKGHFGDIPSYSSMILGKIGGSMGEVSAVALIIGFLYMLWKKIITWHIPVITVLTVVIFATTMHLVNPETYINPLYQTLSGGLLLGAIFMATDYVTSPMNKNGMIIYAIGTGLLTSVIRYFGSYPEGVSFAILIMNAFTPLINTYVKSKRFGEVVKNG